MADWTLADWTLAMNGASVFKFNSLKLGAL